MGRKKNAALDAIISQFPDTEEEYRNYKYVYTLLRSLQADDKTLLDINTDEETELLRIAATRTPSAHKAQAALYLARGYEFSVDFPLTDEDDTAWNTAFKQDELNNTNTTKSDTYPVPASDYVKMTIPQAERSLCYIYIYNIEGKLVLTQTIKESETLVNTSTLSNGTYYYVVVDNNKQVFERNKITIVK